MHAPRLCECHKDQELARTNPRCHKTPFSESSTISNSGQYYQNKDLSRLCLECESARNIMVPTPRLCERHRDQEFPRANPVCYKMPFSDSSRMFNSAQYRHNKDLCGLCLEHESARNVKRRMTEMRQALIEKQLEEQMQLLERNTALLEEQKHLEDLNMRINYLENEFKTSQLLGTLQTEELKEDHYEPRLYKADMYHLGSQVNRADKRSYVYIWQTTGHIRPEMSCASLEIRRPEASTEKIKKEIRVKVEPEGTELPESRGSKLQKKWLEESIQKLRTVGSPVSQQNLQEWFQRSITNFKEKGPQVSNQNLQQWLETTKENLQEKCPQASRKDVKEWLEVSLRNIQEKDPDAMMLNVEEWLETSLKSIQDFQKQGLEASTQAVPKKLEQESPETSKLNVQEYLKTSTRNIQDLQEKGFERSTQNMQIYLPEGPKHTRPEVPELSKDHLRKGWLDASLQNLRRGGSEESRQNVQRGLQAFMSRLSQKGPEASKQNLQEWLEASIKNLQEECPEESRKDIKEWLEISKSYLQEEGPETSKLNVQEWLQASMRSIHGLQERNFEGSAQKVQEDLPKDSEQTKLEVQELRRDHLKKGCLEASIKNLPDEYHEASRKDVKKWVQDPGQSRLEVPEQPRDHLKKSWLEASIENLRRRASEASRLNVQEGLQAFMSRLRQKGPEASKQNLQDWLEARIKNLQEECPEESRKDTKEWLEISKSYLQEEGPETSKLNVTEWLRASMRSIQDLQDRDFGGSAQNVQENLPEDNEKIILNVPELPREHLQKGWLEASVENLRRGRSEASRRNVQEWLQASMKKLKGGPETVKQDLKGWLETSIKNLQEEYPEASREDVKEWLEKSMSYLQKKGPETSKLSVEEWLHASMRGIQGLQSREVSKQSLQVREHELSSTDLHPSWETINLLEQSPEKSSRSGHEWYRSDLIKESFETSEQNAGKWLQLSSDVDSREVSPGSVLDWLSESEGNYDPEYLETPSQPTAARLVRSIRDLPAGGSPSSTLCMRGGLQASIPRVRKGASRLRVQDWLESSMRSLEAAGSKTSKQSLQQWLEESMENLEETCPTNSRHDVQEWLQASLKNLQETNASKLRTEQWIKASLISLKEECPQVPLRDVVEFLQGSIQDLKEEASRLSVQEWLEASLIKLQEEDPESTRDDVKEWLESSLRKFKAVSPETSGHYIKKWLERSLRNLHEPEQNLQEYMKESLMSLRAGGFTATRSRHSWLTVPQSTIRARGSSGILKHGSSIAHLDRRDVSRTSLISKGNEADLEQEEAPEISQIFITSEVHPKILKQRAGNGKWLYDQTGLNVKMLTAKISNAFIQYRKPSKILPLVIPIVLILFAFIHYKLYCSTSEGLPPF